MNPSRMVRQIVVSKPLIKEPLYQQLHEALRE
jgi:hypothetical protein